MIGEIGEAEKKGKTKQEISKIDAETAVLETKRKSEKAQADAELTTTQTNLNMGIKLAQITAQRKAEARDAELQKDVETRRADMELAKRRATDLVHAKIEKEATQENADASLYKETKSADGALYKQKAAADGAMYKARLEAEAACMFSLTPLSQQTGNSVLIANSRLSCNERSRSSFLRKTKRSTRFNRIGQSIWKSRQRPRGIARSYAIYDAAERHVRKVGLGKCQSHQWPATEDNCVEHWVWRGLSWRCWWQCGCQEYLPESAPVIRDDSRPNRHQAAYLAGSDATGTNWRHDQHRFSREGGEFQRSDRTLSCMIAAAQVSQFALHDTQVFYLPLLLLTKNAFENQRY